METISKKRSVGRPVADETRPQQFIGAFVTQEQKRRLSLAAELNGTSVNRMLATMIDSLTVGFNANQ